MKGKLIRTALGIFFVLLCTIFLFFSSSSNKIFEFIENQSYDLELRSSYKPVGKDLPVVVIDIDDETLKEVGRWPWPRKIVADLTEKLYKMGAATVAFDFTFPQKEENPVQEISSFLKKNFPEKSEEALAQLNEIEPCFDFDQMFAGSLSEGNSILGIVFKNEGETQGALPAPFLTLKTGEGRQLLIPNMESYIGNVSALQEAAKNGAFLNASPDLDGVNRFVPLLIRYGNKIFPSLALEAVRVYLLAQNAELILQKYGEMTVLEGVKLDQWEIPTDPWGRILIPFRGPPFTIPYISAADVLKGNAAKTAIANKLVFVGSSATAMADLQVTSMGPTFPGVEIHASIALGILEHYLPFKPAWGKGAAISMVFFLGLLCSLLFPRLDPLKLTIVFFVLAFALIEANHWIWNKQEMVLSAFFPLFAMAILFVMNLVSGYFFETKQRKQIKQIFSQYLPQERIDLLLREKGKKAVLEEESKELTVLFADIRNFTSISEKMSAAELKQFLGLFLTPMTKAIFGNKGTVDKYVGDMIVAFWGAPLEDASHGLNGVKAAWEMQEKLIDLNLALHSEGKTDITLGIGVNTGIMTVGDMGSEFRRAYTVLGDAVNLASRLEQLTKYYGVKIIVGENTKEKAGPSFVYRKLDRVRVKGKEKAEEIFEVVCLAEKREEEKIANLQIYEQALDAYFKQQWKQSMELFQQLLSKDTAYATLYRLYLERITAFEKTPPGPDWNGIFVFETK